MAIPFRQTAWKRLRPVLYRFFLPPLISLGVPPSQLPPGEAIFILNASKGNAAKASLRCPLQHFQEPRLGPLDLIISKPGPAD